MPISTERAQRVDSSSRYHYNALYALCILPQNSRSELQQVLLRTRCTESVRGVENGANGHIPFVRGCVRPFEKSRFQLFCGIYRTFQAFCYWLYLPGKARKICANICANSITTKYNNLIVWFGVSVDVLSLVKVSLPPLAACRCPCRFPWAGGGAGWCVVQGGEGGVLLGWRCV